MYFVTICTKDRVHYFGEIVNGEMKLTEIGQYLQEQIIETPIIRVHMNIEIPLYVIMPNHVHLIVLINENQFNCRDAMHCVSTVEKSNRFGPQSNNLASVIRGIKISTTKFARHNNIPFAWQPRFYDHIIRKTDDMNRIAEYIENNVLRWELDELYG